MGWVFRSTLHCLAPNRGQGTGLRCHANMILGRSTLGRRIDTENKIIIPRPFDHIQTIRQFYARHIAWAGNINVLAVPVIQPHRVSVAPFLQNQEFLTVRHKLSRSVPNPISIPDKMGSLLVCGIYGAELSVFVMVYRSHDQNRRSHHPWRTVWLDKRREPPPVRQDNFTK